MKIEVYQKRNEQKFITFILYYFVIQGKNKSKRQRVFQFF